MKNPGNLRRSRKTARSQGRSADLRRREHGMRRNGIDWSDFGTDIEEVLDVEIE